MTENIIVVGSSGHARVVIDIVEREGRCRIVGLLDASRAAGERTLGYEVLGRETDLALLASRHAIAGVIVAIGDNAVRASSVARLEALCPGLSFSRAVHPGARIARDVSIGDGTVVMAGASVNPCCRIGRHCILNTNCSLDHDSVMEDFASLAPGVSTGGNCHIGAHSAVGIGATLIQGIQVGPHTVIGAGAIVLKSVPAFKVAYGSPARVIRDRAAGDRYL